MELLQTAIDGGATLLFATLVYLELRKIRECMDRTLSALAVEQRAVYHRIKDDHKEILRTIEKRGQIADPAVR